MIGRIINFLRSYTKQLTVYFASSAIVTQPLKAPIYRLVGFKIGKRPYINNGLGLVGKISIGSLCVFGRGCYLDGTGGIVIGDRVHFSPFCCIFSNNHHIMPSVFRRDRKDNWHQPVEIKRGCWIGAGVKILPNVIIEEGCVIGAGSVVNKSTEPNALYAGVPAKKIRDLPVETLKPFEDGEALE